MRHIRDLRVRVLFLQHKGTGVHVAQCLEHDVVAHGNSIPEAIEALRLALSGYLAIALECETELFEGVPPAPQHFHDMFDSWKQKQPVMRSQLRIGACLPETAGATNGCAKPGRVVEETEAEAQLVFAEV